MYDNPILKEHEYNLNEFHFLVHRGSEIFVQELYRQMSIENKQTQENNYARGDEEHCA